MEILPSRCYCLPRKRTSITQERGKSPNLYRAIYVQSECLQSGNATVSCHDQEKPVFEPYLRSRVASTLRLAGMECNVDGVRLGAHSMRSGGATAMFSDGYEVDVIKRWGRWVSSNFQSYIWKGHYAMSSVGRGMLASLPLQSIERGRAGGGHRGKGKQMNQYERSVDISHTTSKILRHKGVKGTHRDGFTPIAYFPSTSVHDRKECGKTRN